MENQKGFKGIGPNAGKFVHIGNAHSYALDKCGISVIDPTAPEHDEFMDMLVEWFFSGNWVEVDGDG